VKEASKKNKISEVYGDTAYDARKNFNLLDELEIRPAIKIRKNARTLSRSSTLTANGIAVLLKQFSLECLQDFTLPLR
jgi:hypothetical protein